MLRKHSSPKDTKLVDHIKNIDKYPHQYIIEINKYWSTIKQILSNYSEARIGQEYFVKLEVTDVLCYSNIYTRN